MATATTKPNPKKRRPQKPAARARIPTHFPESGVATVGQALSFLGIGKTRLYELIGLKIVPSFNEGSKRLFDWADLWDYHRQRKVGVQDAA